MILFPVPGSYYWNLWRKIILYLRCLNLSLVWLYSRITLSHSIYCESSAAQFLWTAGEESVKELQKKRHSATPDISLKGRVRKIAKWRPAIDDESDEEIECKFLDFLVVCFPEISTQVIPLYILLCLLSLCIISWSFFFFIPTFLLPFFLGQFCLSYWYLLSITLWLYKNNLAEISSGLYGFEVWWSFFFCELYIWLWELFFLHKQNIVSSMQLILQMIQMNLMMSFRYVKSAIWKR